MADEESRLSEEEIVALYDEAYRDVPEEDATDDGTRLEAEEEEANREVGALEPYHPEGDEHDPATPPEEQLEELTRSEYDEVLELLGTTGDMPISSMDELEEADEEEDTVDPEDISDLNPEEFVIEGNLTLMENPDDEPNPDEL